MRSYNVRALILVVFFIIHYSVSRVVPTTKLHVFYPKRSDRHSYIVYMRPRPNARELVPSAEVKSCKFRVYLVVSLSLSLSIYIYTPI